MSENTPAHTNSVSLVEPVTDLEVIEEVSVDYTIPIERGQYWVRDLNVIGFVLEVNDQFVIFQNKIMTGPEDGVLFDFALGQEMMSIERFRLYIKEREARLLVIDSRLTDLALQTYKRMKSSLDIANPKELPRNEEEIQEISDMEAYRIHKRIIPPPRKYRSRRGLHWLNTGTSGSYKACKLWDPNVDRDPDAVVKTGEWVLPDGSIDQLAILGVVSSYSHPAIEDLSEEDTESLSDFVVRFIDFLRSFHILFDEGGMIRQLEREATKAFLDESGSVPSFQLTQWECSEAELSRSLIVSLSHNKETKWLFRFSGFLNSEFIPNDSLSVFPSSQIALPGIG